VFSETEFEARVKSGLRGSLQTESLVTGVLYVGISPNTNAPPPVYHQLVKRYLELPTEPTQIQELMSNLASLDIKGLENKLNSLLAKLETTVGELKLADINRGVTNVLTGLSRIVDSPSITNLVQSANSASEEYRILAKSLNGKIDPLADGFTNTLAQVDQTLVQLRGGVQNLRELLGPDSSLRNELTLALEHIAGAAGSISTLMEFLQSHPNALITGRQAPPKKP
jgi:paraquat-inducible protein B